MLNSRIINDLRPAVAANAKLWIAECRAKGLDVEISNTVRDNEYQAYLYTLGRTVKKKADGSPQGIVTNAKTTTFHGAGLAIDFYSKSKGWSDHSFFVECAAIAKKYGFSWAGDWKSFVEYCHIQWDNHRKSNHKNAPQMPLYKEEEDMTAEQTQAMIEKALKARQQPVWDKLEDVPAWGRATVEKLIKIGAIGGNKEGNLELNLDQLRVLVINDRTGFMEAKMNELIQNKYGIFAGIAAVGSMAANQLGGWDAGLGLLIGMIAADVITGYLIATFWKNSPKSESGALSSKAGFKGICKKVVILMAVWIGTLLDAATGATYIRTAIVLFYIGNEGISLIENFGLMGVPYPPAMKKALEAMRDKGEKE